MVEVKDRHSHLKPEYCFTCRSDLSACIPYMVISHQLCTCFPVNSKHNTDSCCSCNRKQPISRKEIAFLFSLSKTVHMVYWAASFPIPFPAYGTNYTNLKHLAQATTSNTGRIAIPLLHLFAELNIWHSCSVNSFNTVDLYGGLGNCRPLFSVAKITKYAAENCCRKVYISQNTVVLLFYFFFNHMPHFHLPVGQC